MKIYTLTTGDIIEAEDFYQTDNAKMISIGQHSPKDIGKSYHGSYVPMWRVINTDEVIERNLKAELAKKIKELNDLKRANRRGPLFDMGSFAPIFHKCFGELYGDQDLQYIDECILLLVKDGLEANLNQPHAKYLDEEYLIGCERFACFAVKAGFAVMGERLKKKIKDFRTCRDRPGPEPFPV